MARSRNEKIGRRIGKAIISGNLTSAGTMVASGVGTTVHSNFDSTGALLNSDSSNYSDGSLHYLSKLRKMYMWDDSDGQFFLLTGVDSDAAQGGYTLRGTTFGYIAGGQYPTGNNMIQKFSFTSDGNASDVSDLSVARGRLSGTSSSEHGYAAGGGWPSNTDVVDRFSFASEENATDVGDLLYTVGSTASHSDGTFGYISGGDGAPSPVNAGLVQRFPFASSITTTDVGNFASVGIQRHAGVSSSTHGYTMGGNPSPNYGDQIHKFDFSSSITSSDIGNLTQARQELCGQSSGTHGYATGGYHVDPTSPSDQTNNIWNTIDKVAFASDGNATDVGNLPAQGGYYRQRSSNANESTTNGYCSGGVPQVIEEMSKFPFASDADGTDIGDLVNPQNALDGAGNMNGR